MEAVAKKVTKTVTFPCPFCEGTGKIYRHYAELYGPYVKEYEEESLCLHCGGLGYYSVKVTTTESFWKLFLTTCPHCNGTGKVTEACMTGNPHEHEIVCPLCGGTGTISRKLYTNWKRRKINPTAANEIDELEF